MHDTPECLSRRYQALDELIDELSLVVASQETSNNSSNDTNDATIKLMCEFWNILKENPDYDLTDAVRQRMGLPAKTSHSFRPQRLTCYMSEKKKCCEEKKATKVCCEEPKSEATSSCSSSHSKTATPPLSKVLCNLKEAVSFDKKCNARIGELMKTQKQLQQQIQELEDREKEGTQLLKQAECMWSCMEAAYKKKVKESLERQTDLLKQMKEIETSNTKWRKNKKDLVFQLGNVDKCCREIKEKFQEKTNDIKCLRMEVDNFNKRKTNTSKQIEAAKKSFDNKKKASDSRTASLSDQVTRTQKATQDELNHKRSKEVEGNNYVKEAREDLQKIYRLLLEKKLENEDLRAEKNELLQEVDLLKKTCEQCKDKCSSKEKTLIDELKKVDDEITGFKVRCIRCHQGTDTGDARKFCTDCPRCAEERECLYKDGHCELDDTMNCVCMSVKQKFMDNVFDNMFTVLEQKVKTKIGKAVADAILDCLKKSRNGKLNEPTRKILQEFVLTAIKKNLNLTIIGGAVKTRCEMDQDTYNQLMLCLNLVQAVPPPKDDKGTNPKKAPCTRWGDTSECNCPKGPKDCICKTRGLPDPKDLDSCPTKDNEDAGEKVMCPHKESAACGVDCAMRTVPGGKGKEGESWKPDPCSDTKCPFSQNMRAAQCGLGPDSLTTHSTFTGFRPKGPYIPDVSAVLENQIVCKCGPTPTKPCACRTDIRGNSRERIIEEVMGIYTDVTPIQKVTMDEIINADLNIGEDKSRLVNSNLLMEEAVELNMSEIRSSSSNAFSSSYIIQDLTHYKEARERKSLYICSKETKKGSSLKEHNFKILRNIKWSKNVLCHLRKQKKMTVLTYPLLNNKSVDEAVGSDSGLVSRCQSIGLYVEPKVFYKSEYNITDRRNINSDETVSRKCVGVTVKKLVKNFISKAPKNCCQRTQSIQWITVESLLKEISSLTRFDSKSGDASQNEIELNNELLSIDDNNLTSKLTQSNVLVNQNNECTAKRSTETNDRNNTTIKCVYISTKHLKTGVEQCDKGTCALIWEQAREMSKLNQANNNIDYKTEENKTTKKEDIPMKLNENLIKRNNQLQIKDRSSEKLERLSSKIEEVNEKPLDGKMSSFTKLDGKKGQNQIQQLNSSLNNIKIEADKNTSDAKNENRKPILFKLVIKDSKKDLDCPLGVLEATKSNNYILSVDKEYEKQYNETMKEYFSSDFECPIKLSKTTSERILIDFLENKDLSNMESNAILCRSLSGNIKIRTDVQKTSLLSDQVTRKSITSDGKRASEVFLKMVNRLTPSKKESLKMPHITGKKSSSESNLLEKVKLQLNNEQNLLSESCAVLKRSASGHYAVILNKDSKKAFINNLKSYVSSNSKGLLPIKRTDQGELIIVLNNNTDETNIYGSLKFTPSGNIYVLVDENFIKKINKNDSEGTTTGAIKQNEPVGRTVQNVVSKNVTTTCNGMPDNECDYAKCNCKEVILHGVDDSRLDYHDAKCVPNFKFCPVENSDYDCRKLKCHYKPADAYSKSENIDMPKKNSPHIVQQCPCRPNLQNGSTSNDRHLFYMSQYVCPFHKDRCKVVSNELLGISGLCKPHFEDACLVDDTYCKNKSTVVKSSHFQHRTDSDYLDTMPPQLPPFLSGFQYA